MSLDEFVDWVKVDEKSVDGSGVSVDKAKLYRLKRWQENVSESKSGGYALGLLGKYSGALEMPKCVYDKSVVVYDDCVSAGLLKGRSVEVLVACSLYIGSRLCNVAYSVDEVVDCVGVGKKEVMKLYKVARKELGLKLDFVRPVDYVNRFSGVLDLDDLTRERVVGILDCADEHGLSNGRSPLGLVGGAIYLASLECGDKRSQRDIGDVLGVSEVTIRKRCSELEKLLVL